MWAPAALALLRCPVSGQPLAPLPEDRLRLLNQRIAKSGVFQQSGTRIKSPLEAALESADGRIAYPVRQNIPLLLKEECFALPTV